MEKCRNYLILLLFCVLVTACLYKPKFNLYDDPNVPFPLINMKAGGTNVYSSYDFGNILNSETAVKDFVIENSGGKDLNISNVAITGTDASFFILNVLPSTTIGSKQASNLRITFNPSGSNGARSAILTINNNSNNQASLIINLTGSATATPVPNMIVQVGSVAVEHNTAYNFGALQSGTIGSLITFTISNNGNAVLNLSNITISGEFEKTDPVSLTVVQGSSTTFTVRFKPTSEGLKSESLSFTHNAPNKTSAYVINLTGNSVLPHISVLYGVTPITTHDFGSVKSGTVSSVNTFTIKNTGGFDLNLTGTPYVSLGGANPGEFEIQSQPSSLIAANGGTSDFTVVFKPTGTAGTRTATLTIANTDSGNNPLNITLNGTVSDADAPKIELWVGATPYASGQTYDFGTLVSGGTGAYVDFTIKNTGTANLTLTLPLAITGVNSGDFELDTVTVPSSPVGISGTTTFRVRFKPLATGTRSASIIIQNNDQNLTLNFQGTGSATSAPIIEVTELSTTQNMLTNSTYSFSTTAYLANVTFKIKNTGSSALTVSAISLSSGVPYWSHAISLPLNIAAGSSSNISISFTPISNMTYSTIITLTNNDTTHNPFIFTIQATKQ